LVYFPTDILYIWTGDSQAVQWAAPLLPLFVLGSAVLAISTFQYHLQFAYGKLRQHVVYNTFIAALSIPLIIYAAFSYGALGVAWVWLGFRLFGLLFWAAYIHHLFAPGLHKVWLLNDVLRPFFVSLFIVIVFDSLFAGNLSSSRLYGLLVVSVLTGFTIVAVLVTSFAADVRKFFMPLQ
jgi:O-antigen/teichoic acid export membrane protein